MSMNTAIIFFARLIHREAHFPVLVRRLAAGVIHEVLERIVPQSEQVFENGLLPTVRVRKKLFSFPSTLTLVYYGSDSLLL